MVFVVRDPEDDTIAASRKTHAAGESGRKPGTSWLPSPRKHGWLSKLWSLLGSSIKGLMVSIR